MYNNNSLNGKTYRKFPYAITDIDPDVNRRLLADFSGERDSFVRVGPKGYFFPSGYRRRAALYYNLPLRPNDIFVVTFPRSGTTWTQEMVWLLANQLDFKTASIIPLAERFPFLEFDSFVHPAIKTELVAAIADDPDRVRQLDNVTACAVDFFSKISLDQTRFIKTHLPFSLLPPDLLRTGCKVIYVARNPRDVIVSFFHLNRLFKTQGYGGDFPKYWRYFQQDLQPWTPYWEHLKEAVFLRNQQLDNFLFLFYEDMKKDTRGTIRKIAQFLGKTEYSEDELEQLEEHLDISKFRRNKAVNMDDLKDLGVIRNDVPGFVREGCSGGWKRYFNGHLEMEVDIWFKKNLGKMQDGFQFPFT